MRGGQVVKNRVTVSIGGQPYTFVAAEEDGYIEKVAAYVDEKLKENTAGGNMSAVDGAILTAMNIADEKWKEQEASENLRRQIKELLEETSQLKLELSEAKREIFKLQQQKNK
jgi:cell division protein ZapA